MIFKIVDRRTDDGKKEPQNQSKLDVHSDMGHLTGVHFQSQNVEEAIEKGALSLTTAECNPVRQYQFSFMKHGAVCRVCVG